MKKDAKPNPIAIAGPAYIHGLSHEGQGIASVNNKTTFISGALPEESVMYRIRQQKNNYTHADLYEIVKPSYQRQSPPCKHFGICGGCSLQHMTTVMQLELKQQTLLEQLKHFGKLVPESILDPLQSDSLAYRRKARLGVKFVFKKNKLLIGFREKASRYLADLDQCEILHPAIGMNFDAIKNLIKELSISQDIPQIEIAIGDNDVALIFRHMKPLTELDKEKLINFGKENNFHIYLQPNPPQPILRLWPEKEFLSYSLPQYNIEFQFLPLDFTQINLEMNRLMVGQAIHLLDLKESDRVLDLFCGIGNFSLPIAKFAAHVTGIEGTDDMVSRAEHNALRNNIHNANFYAANLTNPSLSHEWLHASYNKILLDPPRTGAKEILPYFNKMQAKKIIYVSCNPATFARDAGILVHEHGFKMTQVGIMNMFPHTSHIEAMGVFEKV